MAIFYLETRDNRNLWFNKFIKTEFPEIKCIPSNLESQIVKDVDGMNDGVFLGKQDILLLIGGDGAMLRALHRFAHTGCSFFGKAGGRFNYFMNDFEDDFNVIGNLVRGNLNLDKQSTISLTATIISPETREQVDTYTCFNEFIVGTDLIGNHSFDVSSAGDLSEQIVTKGTGLCIATPFGSSAYSFNNGGELLPLESSKFSLTGIVTETPISQSIDLEEITIRVSTREDHICLYADGIIKRCFDFNTLSSSVESSNSSNVAVRNSVDKRHDALKNISKTSFQVEFIELLQICIRKGKETNLLFLDKSELSRKREQIIKRRLTSHSSTIENNNSKPYN